MAKLAMATDDELELKCKHSGLSRKGGREAQIRRLLLLDAYVHGSSGGGGQGWETLGKVEEENETCGHKDKRVKI